MHVYKNWLFHFTFNQSWYLIISEVIKSYTIRWLILSLLQKTSCDLYFTTNADVQFTSVNITIPVVLWLVFLKIVRKIFIRLISNIFELNKKEQNAIISFCDNLASFHPYTCSFVLRCKLCFCHKTNRDLFLIKNIILILKMNRLLSKVSFSFRAYTNTPSFKSVKICLYKSLTDRWWTLLTFSSNRSSVLFIYARNCIPRWRNEPVSFCSRVGHS